MVDAAGFSDAVVVAEMWGSPVAVMAAGACATVRRLVLFEPYNPWAWDVTGHEWLTSAADQVADGTDPSYTLAPERAADSRFREWLNRSWRLALSPSISNHFFGAMGVEQRDQIRRAYESLQVPTLVIRREVQPLISLSDLAKADEHLGATDRAVVPGRDMFLCGNGVEPILAETARFLSSAQRRPGATQTVEALLYTDIGGSTAAASAAGDDRWNSTIDAHDQATDRVMFRHGGRIIKTTGDGALSPPFGKCGGSGCQASALHARRTRIASTGRHTRRRRRGPGLRPRGPQHQHRRENHGRSRPRRDPRNRIRSASHARKPSRPHRRSTRALQWPRRRLAALPGLILRAHRAEFHRSRTTRTLWRHPTSGKVRRVVAVTKTSCHGWSVPV